MNKTEKQGVRNMNTKNGTLKIRWFPIIFPTKNPCQIND